MAVVRVGHPGRRLRWVRGAVFVGVCAAGAFPALADTIQLTNGRTIEGRVLETNPQSLIVQVEGGSIKLPRAEIAQVRESQSPADDFAIRLLETPLDDPDAVEALAIWARSKGLEDRAAHLRELARGVRLDQRFDAAATQARTNPDPSIYLALAKWARESGHSIEVQRLALDLALELKPDSSVVRHALEDLEASERAHAAAETFKAQQAARAAAADTSLAARERDLRAREQALAERERALREQTEREKTETGDPEGDPGSGEPPFVVLRRPGPPHVTPSPAPSPAPSPTGSPHR